MIVVWNRKAGFKAGVSTNNEQSETELRQLLARHRLEFTLRPTSSAAEAAEIARQARADGVDVVVAAGGDGTVSTVARELIGAEQTALGILPLGSVMNVARALGIPRELETAAALLATGDAYPIDVGFVNGDPFLEAATVGIHAALFEQGSKFDRGDLLALARAAWVAVRYRPSRMRIQLDDREIETKALAVFVANGSHAGLGFAVAPEARVDDGRLDVRIFERFSRLDLLRHFWAIAAGRRGFEPRIETHRSRCVRIDAVSPLPARADGQRLGETPIGIELRQGALNVIVPAGSVRPGSRPVHRGRRGAGAAGTR